MNSTHDLRAIAACLVLLCLYCLAGAPGSALAGEPTPEDRRGAAAGLRIVAPYVEGEMPTAAELLTKCFGLLDKAEAWKADIMLQAASPDWPAEETYVGELHVDKRGLRASLRSRADRDRNLRLLVSDERIVAWLPPATDPGEPQNEVQGELARLKQLAGSIKLLGVVGRLPGDPRRLSEIGNTYTFANKGVAKAETGESYVLEVAPKKPEESSQQRLLMAISVATSLPTHFVSHSANGGRRMLKLDSIDLNATVDEQPLAAKPPEGAIVMDLKPNKSATAGLKNPIPYGPESIARGKRLYRADCVVCHSIDGTGRDSDVTDNASDLTDTTHWNSDGSESATFLAIRDGAGDEMPGYEDEYGDDKSIWDLVNYIRSLQKKQ